MKTIRGMIAVAGITLALQAPAQAQQPQDEPQQPTELQAPLAVGNPTLLLYRVSGMLSAAGVATSLHCSNFSSDSQSLRVLVEGPDGTVLADTTFDIGPKSTRTASTLNTVAYFDDPILNTVNFRQGMGSIFATARKIVCTATTTDAATVVPVGVSLNMIRFNPISGTQE